MASQVSHVFKFCIYMNLSVKGMLSVKGNVTEIFAITE